MSFDDDDSNEEGNDFLLLTPMVCSKCNKAMLGLLNSDKDDKNRICSECANEERIKNE